MANGSRLFKGQVQSSTNVLPTRSLMYLMYGMYPKMGPGAFTKEKGQNNLKKKKNSVPKRPVEKQPTDF